MILLIMLTCSACVRHVGDPALRLLPAAAADAGRAPWWSGSGDPLLDRLTRQALADDTLTDVTIPGCRPSGARFRKVFARARVRTDRATAVAQAWDRVAQRLDRAQAIGLAYLDTREWQARLAQRLAGPTVLKDNALIARFRREAGLVPALDEDMAAIMLGLNGADADIARTRLDDAIAGLAQATGQPPADLRKMLDSGLYTWPIAPPGADEADVWARPELHALEARLLISPALRRLGPDAVDAQLQRADRPEWAIRWTRALALARQQTSDARATLASSRDQIARRDAIAAEADKVVNNARLGYRNGAAVFATLYAAEAAAMATHEGQIAVHHAAAAARIRLWTAQGQGETVREGSCD